MGGSSYAALAVRMALGLVAVGVVAVLVLRASARRLRPGGGDGERLRVVDRCVLEPGRTLHLVEAPGKDLLVATDPQGTSLLAELERGDA